MEPKAEAGARRELEKGLPVLEEEPDEPVRAMLYACAAEVGVPVVPYVPLPAEDVG